MFSARHGWCNIIEKQMAIENSVDRYSLANTLSILIFFSTLNKFWIKLTSTVSNTFIILFSSICFFNYKIIFIIILPFFFSNKIVKCSMFYAYVNTVSWSLTFIQIILFFFVILYCEENLDQTFFFLLENFLKILK